jgi:hypothetical protein
VEPGAKVHVVFLFSLFSRSVRTQAKKKAIFEEKKLSTNINLLELKLKNKV